MGKRKVVKWTLEEDNYLYKNYSHMRMVDMEKELGRTAKSIYDRGGKLGLSRRANKKTNEQFVKEFYSIFPKEEYTLLSEYVSTHIHVEYLGGYKKFKSQIKRDNIKLNFAENNGYTLIEVPYYLDTYKKVRNYLEKKL